MSIIQLFALFTFFGVLTANVNIIGPLSLVWNLKKIDNGIIRSQIGNFGEVPYGKSIVGYVYYQKNTDGSNTWCNIENTVTPPEIQNNEYLEYNSIFIVDHSTDCKYTTKAKNVRKRGGKVMLLAYDSNVLSDEFNVDDQIGDTVDIPTVIITKDVGEALKEHLSQIGHESVIMSIKFSGVKDNGYLDMKMFFRSDDVKSLSFFREFSYYKDKLINKLRFTPVYKYNIYTNDETSNVIDDPDSDEQSTAPCVKTSHYCVSPNNELKIQNPRYILLENIRQSCIYTLYDLSEYWTYMEAFSELCADPNNPTFNPECSMNALKSAGLYDREENITDCMHGLIENKAKIEDDYNLYNKKRVYKTPELLINGVKYRGDWYSRYIFNSICTGFIEDDEICGTPKPEEVKTSNFAFKTIGYTILVIAILMIILLICYRRYVNRSLEDTLNEKIQEQAMKVIGEYNAFKDKGGKAKDFFSRRGGSGNSSKLELVSE